MTSLVTVSEAVTVLAELGYELTERQIRYLGLVPSQRWPGGNGARLFDPVDVTLLAVFADVLARCREWGLPAWSARAALTYQGDALRRAVVRRSPRFLLVDSSRGTVMLSETRDADTYAIDVRALAARVNAAVRQYRALEPSIWTGAERVPLREVASV